MLFSVEQLVEARIKNWVMNIWALTLKLHTFDTRRQNSIVELKITGLHMIGLVYINSYHEPRVGVCSSCVVG
jgi:hypothetical protein